MKTRQFITIDGNEAVASVAYHLNEVIAVYPITPASPMEEWANAWAAGGMRNIWGTVYIQCGKCVMVSPLRSKSEARTKAINMRPQAELREGERNNWDFFLSIPDRERPKLSFANVRESLMRDPALIIAYSHCIAHGINMTTAMQNQKAAVLSGQWRLYRHDPRQAGRGEPALHIDSPAPKLAVQEYLNLENRFKMLSKARPAEAKLLFREAQKLVNTRWQLYQQLARNDSIPKKTE